MAPAYDSANAASMKSPGPPTAWVLIFWTLGRTLGGLPAWDAPPVVGLLAAELLAVVGLFGWGLLRGRASAKAGELPPGSLRICRFGKKNCRNGIAEAGSHGVLARVPGYILGREGASRE